MHTQNKTYVGHIYAYIYMHTQIMILRLISNYSNRVRHCLGNAFIWPFSVPIRWRPDLKKQSRDPDVVGEFKVAPAKARVSEKMRYVNVKVHDNRCLFRKRE